MKLLILGGTIFLGRHLVEIALERGHEVTLFNRGKHSPELFPQVEKLRGDRDGDLSALRGRTWDAVIDTCGYVPRIVRSAAEMLADTCGHYTFISSISVYANNGIPHMDESGAVGTLEDPAVEVVDGGSYGPLKALCEQAAEQAFPGRTLNIRPGLIVGPHDPSDRFTYWPVRLARGGDVVTPADQSVPVQVIDCRDLADWNLRMVEAGKVGVYNATGPDTTLTLHDMLQACLTASGRIANLIRVDEQWLEKHEVHAWSDLPVWVPDSEEMRGFSRINFGKAIADGLTFRPIETIAEDTLAWAANRGPEYVLRAGLTPERERELLEKWRSEPGAAAR